MQGRKNVITYILKSNYKSIILKAGLLYFDSFMNEIEELKGYRWENMNHFRVNNKLSNIECIYIQNRLFPKYLFIQETVDFTFVESIFHRQKII